MYDVAKNIGRHFIEKYGSEEVRSWLFENNNEPGMIGGEEFLKHFDACSQGFHEADPLIRFGGPGICHSYSSMNKLLDHCVNGTNYITKKKGTPIAWYSIHTKMEANEAIETQIAVIKAATSAFPQFAKLPFLNDEGDRKSKYEFSHWWHPLPAYAAWMADMVNQTCVRIIDDLGANYYLWCNDNEFMGFWERRSLFVGVQMAQVVKKPCYNALVMFSLLGDARVKTTGTPPLTTGNGVLATRRGKDQVAILIYNSSKRNSIQGKNQQVYVLAADSVDRTVTLNLSKIPFSAASLVHYRMDDLHTNPYRLTKDKDIAALPQDQRDAWFREAMELKPWVPRAK